jgi:hypothetical protein
MLAAKAKQIIQYSIVKDKDLIFRSFNQAPPNLRSNKCIITINAISTNTNEIKISISPSNFKSKRNIYKGFMSGIKISYEIFFAE